MSLFTRFPKDYVIIWLIGFKNWPNQWISSCSLTVAEQSPSSTHQTASCVYKSASWVSNNTFLKFTYW